jgi:DNA-binding response OmpR family regulator
MSSAKRPRILVAADDGLAERIGPSLPEFEVMATPIDQLPGRAHQLKPRVVLCVGPDAGEALAIMRRLRVTEPDARSILVTPPKAAAERVAALEAGVDDAIPTPVDDRELVGRLRVQAGRARPRRLTRLPVGDGMELDLDRRELLRDGRWVHLRPKEAGLLELMARSPGRAMSRDHILDRVWGPEHDGDPRTVDVHVRWLRAKIEPDPRVPVWLVTVRGVGYRLEPLPLTER